MRGQDVFRPKRGSMFDSQLLIATGSAYSVFSPWFPRGGDILRATAEVTMIYGTNAKLTVRVFTKNSETTGDGVDVDTAVTADIERTAAGRETKEWSGGTTGLLELVRYKFTIEGNAGAFVLFRMLTPVWLDAVAAS